MTVISSINVVVVVVISAIGALNVALIFSEWRMGADIANTVRHEAVGAGCRRKTRDHGQAGKQVRRQRGMGK